jgi:ABC-2 type transport system permease protein
VNALVGVGIVTFSLIKLGIVPRADQIVLYHLGCRLWCDDPLLDHVCPFDDELLDRARAGLIYGYFNLFNIARYPDVVFRVPFG